MPSPGWKPNGKTPFLVREHFTRGEFASEIVDSLDRLRVAEVGTEKNDAPFFFPVEGF
jgi:hypothetical protein